MSRLLIASTGRLNASTFSCDIAYSDSPTASRACLGSRYSRTRITLPLLNSTIQAIADSVIAPLSLPRRPEVTDGDDSLAKVPDLCLLCLDLREGFFPVSDSLADALVPPVHGGSPAELNLQPGVPLDLGVEFVEHRSHVAAVVGVRHAPNDLDVLLRHRLRSISLGGPGGCAARFARVETIEVGTVHRNSSTDLPCPGDADVGRLDSTGARDRTERY